MKNTTKFSIAMVLICICILCFSLNCFAAEKGRVNCDLLNVRVSPNTNCEIISKLYTGTTFDIIYTDNGWYNIRMNNGVTGFVCADYVTRFDAESLPSASYVGETIANNAQSFIGYPYVYGDEGPYSFDCSGLVYYLYIQQGYSVPRTADVQAECGMYVDKSNLLPGDLVFFSNRSNRSINHVGIYVGNGEFVHASTSIRGVVKDSLYSDYYVRNFVTARRLV